MGNETWKKVEGDPLPYHYKYEHSALTTDCVIFGFDGKDLNVLLIKRGVEPYEGAWAIPGGFLRNDETAEAGALRELKEETELEPENLKLVGVFSDPKRDPRERVVTIAYYALVKPRFVKGGDDAAEAKWFHIDALPPLAFDHGEILSAALERLRQTTYFEPIGLDLMEKVFKLSDLQRLYEAILGVKLDRRNFQKKILSLGILSEVNPNGKSSEKPIAEGSTSWSRVAKFYRFKPATYKKMKSSDKKGKKLEF